MNDFQVKLRKFRYDYAACGIICLVIALFYGCSWNWGGDVWDDSFYLALFRKSGTFQELLRQLQVPVLRLYSPVVTLSFWIDRCFSENTIVAAHIANLLYFMLGSCGLYCFFRQLVYPWRISRLWALTGTLLWCLQPQRLESVVWISERKDMLLCCCAWWGLFFFIRSARCKKYSLPALLLFGISFGIKPALIALPAILVVWLLAESGSWKKLRWRLTVPYWCISFAAALLFLLSRGEAATHPYSFWERCSVMAWNFGNYFFTALFPVGYGPFHPFYPEPGWNFYWGTLLIIGIFLVLFCRFPQHRLFLLRTVGALIVIFLLLLSPVIGWNRIGNADWADRYNLLPSACCVLALTAAAAKFSWFRVLYLLLLLWSGIACCVSLPVWKNAASVEAAALNVPVANYRVVFLAGTHALQNQNEKQWEILQKKLPEEEKLSRWDQERVGVFMMAMKAGWHFRKKELNAGIAETEKLLNHPRWRDIALISEGFPQQLLTDAAAFYLEHGENRNAAEVFERLSLCYPDSMEEFFYGGLAKLLNADYRNAVFLLEKAAALAPEDTAVRYQLERARRGLHKPDSAEK